MQQGLLFPELASTLPNNGASSDSISNTKGSESFNPVGDLPDGSSLVRLPERLIPLGVAVPFLGTVVPPGWIWAGATYSIGDYPELLEVLRGKVSVTSQYFTLPNMGTLYGTIFVQMIIKAKV